MIAYITNKALRQEVERVYGISEQEYSCTKVGYDLKRLVVKNIIKRVEGTHRYVFTELGYKLCLMFLLKKRGLLNP